jgi:hypothetical protein
MSAAYADTTYRKKYATGKIIFANFCAIPLCPIDGVKWNANLQNGLLIVFSFLLL